MGSFFEPLQREIEASQKQLDKVFGLSKNKALTVTFLKEKLDKEKLATLVMECMKRTQACVGLMRKASDEVEVNQKEAKLAGNEVMKLQAELLHCKTEQIDQFKSLVDEKLKSTIKTQLQDYSEAVKKNAGESLTIRNIKTVVKDVVKNVSGNIGRDKNLIMFGLDEESGENLSEKVANVLSTVEQKPRFDAVRLGNTAGKRPVRVTVDRPETVFEILRAAKNLKKSDHYSNVYISFDRSPEQRAERKNLVELMKKKIAKNPDQKYYIKRGEICCDTESVRESVDVRSESEDDTEQILHAEPSPVREMRPPPCPRGRRGRGPGITPPKPRKPAIFSESSVHSSDEE